METDFNIEVQANTGPASGTVQLPVNFITNGQIENDDVKVYIKQDVYKKMECFARSDMSKEVGSILLGDYVESLGKLHVVISEFIEAKHTDASASTLTFTHETWDYIHREHDRLLPGLKIVGWQHTHPNYGIFLSSYDMFIQENFFNMPFQVAYVIDPLQNARGFFQWKNGKVEKLNGFHVFDDVGRPIVEQQKQKAKAMAPAFTKKQTILFFALLAVLAIGSTSLFLALNDKLQTQIRQQEELEATIARQELEIENQNTSIAELQDTLTESAFGSENSTARLKT